MSHHLSNGLELACDSQGGTNRNKLDLSVCEDNIITKNSFLELAPGTIDAVVVEKCINLPAVAAGAGVTTVLTLQNPASQTCALLDVEVVSMDAATPEYHIAKSRYVIQHVGGAAAWTVTSSTQHAVNDVSLVGATSLIPVPVGNNLEIQYVSGHTLAGIGTARVRIVGVNDMN